MAVEIIESYKDWSPPAGVRASVKALVQAVPERYLAGLSAVVLSNTGALTGRRKRRKVSSSRGKFGIDEVLGVYHGGRQPHKAWIELFIDRILDGYPRLVQRVPLIREVVLAETLFHELGHHIHDTQRPEHRDKELVADDWALRLSRTYFRRKYWYLRPFVWLARRALRILHR